MNNTYWIERLAETQNNLTDKNIKQIEKQLRKYYSNTMKKIIADFETVYDKLLIDMLMPFCHEYTICIPMCLQR